MAWLVVYDDAEDIVYLEESGSTWTSHRNLAHRFEDQDSALIAVKHWRYFGKTESIYVEVA